MKKKKEPLSEPLYARLTKDQKAMLADLQVWQGGSEAEAVRKCITLTHGMLARQRYGGTPKIRTANMMAIVTLVTDNGVQDAKNWEDLEEEASEVVGYGINISNFYDCPPELAAKAVW